MFSRRFFSPYLPLECSTSTLPEPYRLNLLVRINGHTTDRATSLRRKCMSAVAYSSTDPLSCLNRLFVHSASKMPHLVHEKTFPYAIYAGLCLESAKGTSVMTSLTCLSHSSVYPSSVVNESTARYFKLHVRTISYYQIRASTAVGMTSGSQILLIESSTTALAYCYPVNKRTWKGPRFYTVVIPSISMILSTADTLLT